MAEGTPEYDERFVHFIVLFNVDEDYFECHEVMEELWLEEGRSLLYQGLLQAAVGLHHWRNDNYTGAVKLFTQSENKLVRYPDVTMGLSIRQLRDDVERSLKPLRHWVEQSPAEAPPPFRPFKLAVTDDRLRMLAEAMAEIPLEERLHGEEPQ
ncbi:DUF309 domain-containing protein [Paenibacillus humicola]|uniref:DUF309 domain-containing protein n=1 Tax=Paenibacillus humicola TaxID=3110540 RepID=UPI00237BFBC9|nr:DUF309 domain-containing protein [Paenibacillus humicola]